jgi:hypothetical protein
VPNPLTVDCKLVSRKGVDTTLLRLTVEIYPRVPNPIVVDVRFVAVIDPPELR